jgi:Cu/Zn superoxide dismutase
MEHWFWRSNKRHLGKGLIVHEGTDDFVSQPSGNAGARVACSASSNNVTLVSACNYLK